MPSGRSTAPLQLEAVPQASSQARRYVRQVLSVLGADDLIDAAELGVSELVTNACLHARTAITVAVVVTTGGTVRIEVGDASPRPPRERKTDAMTTTGRGLRLLSAYGKWGIDAPTGAGKTVWFEPLPDGAMTTDRYEF